MKRSFGSAFRNLMIFLGICMAPALYLMISNAVIEPQAHISPDYPRADIRSVLEKSRLGDGDYRLLFLQTGLGRPAVDELRAKDADPAQSIRRFQDYFFRDVRFICENNSPVSKEESLVNENGKLMFGTEFAALHTGDILVTKSSHTFGWRNGHCAIVIDPVRGLTLESVVLGMDSSVQDISKWLNYPNFMLLRARGFTEYGLKVVARTAAERLNGIPYDLTVGIFSPKDANSSLKNMFGKISGTHCSHLVWQSFKCFGLDIDTNGGILVTPKDIANSSKLDIIQVYGVNPRNIWP